MPTTSQIKTIQLGRKVCELNDQQYRTLLRSVAGVESCTKLDNRGVENVLAVLEASGFDSHPAGPTYWRDKAASRGERAGERMVHKIVELQAGQRYALGGLCLRFSDGRTDRPDLLRPHEAWRLIEMLKAAAAREPALF
jgi:hypothetical protein